MVQATPGFGSPVVEAESDDDLATIYHSDSTIKGIAPFSEPRVFAAIHNMLLVQERKEVWDYLWTRSVLCEIFGLDLVVLAAQWSLETGTGNSSWWRERKNPAGIGVTGALPKIKPCRPGQMERLRHMAMSRTQWERVLPDDWPSPLEVDQRVYSTD